MTFKPGQQVKYNQGRGYGLIGKIIRVDAEAKELVIKAEANDLAFKRSFDKVKPYNG